MKKYVKWVMLAISIIWLAAVVYYSWPLIAAAWYFIRGGGIH